MNIKLGDICRFQSGGTPSKKNPMYFNGTIPWITTVALNNKLIDEHNAVDWITKKAINESGAKIVPANSLMVGTRVGIGKTAINAIPMSTNQDIISLLDIDETKWSKNFLCRFINSKRSYLISQARGVTIKGVKIDILASLDLPVLPLDEQNRISQLINEVEKVIDNYEYEIAEMDKIVKVRFVEMFESDHEQWDQRKLSDCCNDTNDIKCGPFGSQLHAEDYCQEGIPVYGIPEVNAQFKVRSKLYVAKEKADELTSYSLLKGDIAVSRKGNVGQAALFDDAQSEGIIHSDVLRIRLNKQIMQPLYLVGELHYSQRVLHQIQSVSSGAIMPGTNVTKLKSIIVDVPPLELQNEYADFVRQVDKSKVAVQKSLDETRVLFDALMQKYFG